MLPAERIGSEGESYPVALASHDDVVKDSSLFWETLRSFHRFMGTKLMVPVIGGKELNLHVLYIEVTKRGGFSKELPWFTERYYISYSFKIYTISLFVTGHSSFQATGMIDTKFEYGYIVTMQLDTEILHGVLYHPQHSVIVSNNLDSTRRRRKRRNEGDPTRPKTNRSGYNFFFAEKHAELKSKYPLREREFTKMIGESWTNLCPEDKMVYQNQGLKDKERYQRELAEYKERAKEWKPKVTVD
ncbi:hypothetical protein Ccrd_014320 [Cynara cardunculus var. scolymus]|uniref:High mobility group (HMG) box domain-containing protein n=1 Tax=Cynara cardunculus var. scolymus TaxID=59895 RepID=A0A103YDY6_CYNCS|nr:hypothetical protein Ccrd_014320 [Cynara cardunculus var. scolymus]